MTATPAAPAVEPETESVDESVAEAPASARSTGKASQARTAAAAAVTTTTATSTKTAEVDDELEVDNVGLDDVEVEQLEEQLEAQQVEQLEEQEVELLVTPRPARTSPVRRAAPASPAAGPHSLEVALSVDGLTKKFGSTVAVDDVHLEVRAGSLFGIVGPNGAGKTTTLSMVTGLLRPDRGVVRVYGADVWENPTVANRSLGVLPDRLRLFDRLTGAEFLHHAGALHGLDRATVQHRAADLATAFGLQSSMNRLVADFSVGLTKKIAIAAAMIHSPRLLVLDEPFESVDPVSSATVIDILTRFTQAGGTVLLSSHSMDLIERVCDSVAIIAEGRVLTAGALGDVLEGKSLERRFVELAGGTGGVEGMEWLQNFSD